MSADALTRRLALLDTPAVSDAIDRLGLSGRVTGLHRQSTARRIAGRVMTVKLGTEPPADSPPRHLCTAAIEAAAPGDIIVVEQRTGIEAAGWGGILSTAAKVRGLAGVIVDGPARDIDESRELDFAVFARSVIPTTARGRIHEVDFNCPIQVGEIAVAPGDLVLADGSGIVFLAAAEAERIVEAAEYIAAREALMAKAVLAGEPVSQVMGGDYEHMLKKDEGN